MAESDEIVSITKKKSLFRKILSWLAIIIIALLVIVSIGIMLLAYNKGFRTTIISQILNIVNTQLTAKVEIGDIHLIGFGGIKLDEVRLITGADTLADVKEIIADISLEPLLRNKIQVNKLILNSPRIMLLRRKSDSSWNFTRIAPPAPEKPPTETDLTIRLRNFEFRNGTFFMIDSLADDMPKNMFNASSMKFNDLTLKLGADVNLKTNEYDAKIKEIKLTDETSGIKLDHFSGNLNLSPKGIKLESTKIKSDDWTANTSIAMLKFNVFGSPEEQDLNNTVFDIVFDVNNFNPKFPNHFAIIPIKMGGRHDVSLIAKGTLNDLNISKLDLAFDNTHIVGTGTLTDVMKGDLKYNFNFTGTSVEKKDIPTALPFIAGELLPKFEKAEFKQLNVEGDTRHVKTSFDFTSAAGSVEGESMLRFDKGLDYSGNVSTEDLNLSLILNNNSFVSKINSKIVFKGSGSNLADLNVKVDIKSDESDFAGFHYSSLRFLGSFIANDSLRIDTLRLVLPNPDADPESMVFDDRYSSLTLHGSADISDIKHPKYNFISRFKSINLKRMFTNNALPTFFTGNFNLVGEGIDLDRINADLTAHFEEMLFPDKAMMPFDLSASIAKVDDSTRIIDLKSQFINATLSGKFKTSELIQTLTNQGTYLATFITDKLDLIFPTVISDTVLRKREFRKGSFPDIDCELVADIVDFSPASLFIKGMDISTSMIAKISIQSTPKDSYINIDSLLVRRLVIKKSGMDIRANSLYMSGIMNINIIDSVPKFSYIDVSARTNRRVYFNEMFLTRPLANIAFDGDTIQFNASTGINRILNVATTGSFDISRPEVSLCIDSLMVNYDSLFAWKNTLPLMLALQDERITVKQFQMQRGQAEKLVISGSIDENIAKSLNISLVGMPLPDMLKLMPNQKNKELQTLKGTMDSMNIAINGSLLKPEIDFLFGIKEIGFNNQNIGNLDFKAKYSESNIAGSLIISNPIRKINQKMLEIKIISLPVYLGIDSLEMFSSTKETKIDLIADNLPLQMVSPFVPNVSNLQGTADATLSISGILPSKLDYKGNVEVSNGSFLLQNTNVVYLANGSFSLTKDKIVIDKLNLKNTNSDFRGGSANVTGSITLKDFMPDYLDISITAGRFLVLNDATARVMPGLYGKFIIGTESRPLRFYGTLDYPNLSGDVVIWDAELKMPKTVSQQIYKTTFTYEVRGKSKIYKFVSRRDSTLVEVPEPIKAEEKKNIADQINYDLSIKIKNFTILLDMGSLGEIYAKIGTRDPSVPMRYVKYRNQSAPKLYSGELEVKEGSTVKIFRIMETKGIISFPTGAIDNPSLDLEARYDGTYSEGTTITNYSVFVYITGTKDQPHIELEYTLNGNPGTGDPKKIEEEAFFLLTTGKTKSGFGGGNSDFLGEGLNMGVSQLASKSLTELLLGTGVIQSADVRFGGQGLETAQVNLSGSLYGIGNWSVGGNISDLSNNYEVTFEIPISLQSKALSNFILQLSKSTNLNINNQLQDSKDFEVKIKFGGSW